MIACADAVVDGFLLEKVRFSGDAVFNIQTHKISLFLIFNRLKKGKFQLVKKLSDDFWILRSENIAIMLDFIRNVVIAVTIFEFKEEKPLKHPRLGDLIASETLKEIQIDLMVKAGVQDCEDYLSEYMFLNELKMKGVNNECH